MSDSLNRLLVGIVFASLGVITFRGYRRRMRSRAIADREVTVSGFIPPALDRERPIARAREYRGAPDAAGAPARDRLIAEDEPLR